MIQPEKTPTHHMKQAALIAYALSLPETAQAPHFDYDSIRVKGKILLTLPPDQAFAHIFVDAQHRDMAVGLYPSQVEPLHWGEKILGVRLRLEGADEDFVQALVLNAWQNKAPKTLVKAHSAL